MPKSIRVLILGCADEISLKKLYSETEIEALKANPNVKSVQENRLVLTYECRTALYDAWEKRSSYASVREEMTRRGMDLTMLGPNFVKDLIKTFRRYGRPSNGRNSFKVETVHPEFNEALLASGKFKKSGKGICFTEQFATELAAKYPEQSIEDGLKAAGIDPGMVGYQRIYQLKRKIEAERRSPEDGSETEMSTPKVARTKASYNEETVQAMQQHPYVERASAKHLVFHHELYADAAVLAEQHCSVSQILEAFEIPRAWMSHTREYQLIYRCKHHADKHTGTLQESTGSALADMLPPDQQNQYFRIQCHRIKALGEIAQNGFHQLGAQMKELPPDKRRQVCQWLRDDVRKEENGAYSMRGILKQMALSKSTYYGILKNDLYGESYLRKEQQDIEDGKIIREVIDYKGYPKGSRQVFMQMKRITGQQMSHKKIVRIMQKNHWQSTVRKANNSLRAARKRLRTHLKPNLLKRRFRLHRPREVFLTDVTYMKYGHNQLAYGSASLDSVTGRVYTIQISECNDLPLVLNTLHALPMNEVRKTVQPMLHSDQGALYLTDEFQELVKELGMQQSMSKRGNCWDNACQESFFGHMKDECPYKTAKNVEELKRIVEEYRVYFNEERGQWNRNRMTPMEFEAYLDGMSEEAFQTWLQNEEKRYEAMKERSRLKAIERAKTLGV